MSKILEAISEGIDEATSNLIFIILENHKHEKKRMKELAKMKNYSYRLFTEFFSEITSDGKMISFPSIKEQLGSWVFGIVTEEGTQGIIMDKFDFDIINSFNLKVQIFQELKRFASTKKMIGKLAIVNSGRPLEEMFEYDLINQSTVIRL